MGYTSSMKLDIFTLCDAAGITTERKLVIHGAFDNIFAAGVPFTYPALSIAIRLRCDLADEGRHTLALRFLGSDGGELLPTLKGELNVRPPVNGTLRTFCVDHIIVDHDEC